MSKYYFIKRKKKSSKYDFFYIKSFHSGMIYTTCPLKQNAMSFPTFEDALVAWNFLIIKKADNDGFFIFEIIHEQMFD